jgi:ABC-type transport system involved in cytochrome bd biosynthesis fused ATPase/permease subunit
MANRPTIVAISHRTTAIDHFDSIYQLRGGRLISSDDETPC